MLAEYRNPPLLSDFASQRGCYFRVAVTLGWLKNVCIVIQRSFFHKEPEGGGGTWFNFFYSVANYRPHVSHFWANLHQILTCRNLLTPEIPQMCGDPILVTLLVPIENATPL